MLFILPKKGKGRFHMGYFRKIAVVGLGYVGLPVAIAFGKKAKVIGFDVSVKRIKELNQGIDSTKEIPLQDLKEAEIEFTSERERLKEADFFIVTVPTLIDNTRRPDMCFIHKACEILSAQLKKGDIVVFESTVYPGAIEEECIPLLERTCRLRAGIDFGVGYSPERINPGDALHTFTKVSKVLAALDPSTLDIMSEVYGSVVEASLHRVSQIKVAEACKLLENAQRDVNIALINECAMLFEKMAIATQEVLAAAQTKWNFSPYFPGLVGGHCIGVDPYYLSFKAQQLGCESEVILAARRVNNRMGKFIAEQTVKKMIQAGSPIKHSKVAVLGLTFKENCRDLRNSKVMEVIQELESFDIIVQVHDPISDEDEVLREYGLELLHWDEIQEMEALIFCVAHQAYRALSVDTILAKLSERGVIMDVKNILEKSIFADRGVEVWQL